MDWVDGTDLAQLLLDRGAPGLAPSSVLAYLAEAAEALTFLHVQDPPIIHGDVKPANLILTRGGRVKLVDFGLSSTPGMEGHRAGTEGFRAPELAAGGSPSRASDLYALAATAFALLPGRAWMSLRRSSSSASSARDWQPTRLVAQPPRASSSSGCVLGGAQRSRLE